MVDRDSAEGRAERGAEAGAERAVRRALQMIGVDILDQDSMNGFRDDLSYLRKMRVESETRKNETWKTIYATVIGAVVAAVGGWVTGFLKIGGH